MDEALQLGVGRAGPEPGLDPRRLALDRDLAVARLEDGAGRRLFRCEYHPSSLCRCARPSIVSPDDMILSTHERTGPATRPPAAAWVPAVPAGEPASGSGIDDVPPEVTAQHAGQVTLHDRGHVGHRDRLPPVSADSVVTPACCMLHGTMRSYQERSQSAFSASPCMVTPWPTCAPIAPTLRSGWPASPRTQAPLRPATRSALPPLELRAGPDHRFLEGAHVGHHVQGSAQLDDRIAGQLPGAVPGDLAAAVHVDNRRARIAERPVGCEAAVRLPAVYTGSCSSSRQLSGTWSATRRAWIRRCRSQPSWYSTREAPRQR